MNSLKKGELFTSFTIRIIGAITASIGFFLIAYQQTILGTSLVGIDSVLIAAGEK